MSEAAVVDRDRPRWRTPLHRPRLAFRRWRRTRPFWAGLWTLLGGLIITLFPLQAIRLMFLAGQVVWLAILVGVLIALCGLFLWIEPPLRRVISALALLLGVLSLITSDVGGFVIGMLLTLVGGSMGLIWMPVKPKAARQAVPAPAVEARAAASPSVDAGSAAATPPPD